MMIHIIRNFTFSFSRKLRIPLYNAAAMLRPLSNFISKTSLKTSFCFRFNYLELLEIQSCDLLITSMITDRIIRHEILLSINHNHYNVRKNKHIQKKYLRWRQCLMLKFPPSWKFPVFLQMSGFCDQFCDWWI